MIAMILSGGSIKVDYKNKRDQGSEYGQATTRNLSEALRVKQI